MDGADDSIDDVVICSSETGHYQIHRRHSRQQGCVQKVCAFENTSSNIPTIYCLLVLHGMDSFLARGIWVSRGCWVWSCLCCCTMFKVSDDEVGVRFSFLLSYYYWVLENLHANENGFTYSFLMCWEWIQCPQVVGMASIRGVNVPMYTTLRRTTVLFTMIMEFMLAGQRHTPPIITR